MDDLQAGTIRTTSIVPGGSERPDVQDGKTARPGKPESGDTASASKYEALATARRRKAMESICGTIKRDGMQLRPEE